MDLKSFTSNVTPAKAASLSATEGSSFFGVRYLRVVNVNAGHQRPYHNDRSKSLRCEARAQVEEDGDSSLRRNGLYRREAVVATLGLTSAAVLARPACAASFSDLARAVLKPPPPGFLVYVDRFNGLSFVYPSTWVEVRGAGTDAFFRNPMNLDENVIVTVSSPTSSRFKSVRDLGDPFQAAGSLQRQYLTEFMSTRLGVRREAEVLAAKEKLLPPGKDDTEGSLAYEVELNIKSFANNNQLAVMPEERVQVLEWSRRYLTVLAVANKRLYQLRLQVPERVVSAELDYLRQVMDSFQVYELL